jgi:DNA-binding LacI/PurR family transcriptional regulator
MATRLEIQARRQALYDSLKHSCLNGAYAPDVLLPPVRELGEQHGVSTNVVFQVIQSLADEGVLYTVPRVGAFAGKPRRETIEPYLLILPQLETQRTSLWAQTQTGFEDRIAQLGGHSIVLAHDEARAHHAHNELPPLSGIFEFRAANRASIFEDADAPCVYFGDREARADADCIKFDDVAGGSLATRHLQQNGHRTIAFLGLHSRRDVGDFPWSAGRERGWRQVASQVHGKRQLNELSFLPSQPSGLGHAEQIAVGREMAQLLIGRDDITAVVVANMWAASGMFEAFRDARWERRCWPAVVCFDSAPGASTSVVSYLRLPWEEVGREAAQVLWERRTGRLAGAGIERRVPMRLIPRLSCRADWAQTSELAQKRLAAEPILQGAVA